jgi:hypothetical protein
MAAPFLDYNNNALVPMFTLSLTTLASGVTPKIRILDTCPTVYRSFLSHPQIIQEVGI